MVLFAQKIVTKRSKIWVGIRDPEKTYFGPPDPCVKEVPDSGYGSATLQKNLGLDLKPDKQIRMNDTDKNRPLSNVELES